MRRNHEDDFDAWGEYGRPAYVERPSLERADLPRGIRVTDTSKCPVCRHAGPRLYAALGNVGWFACEGCGREFMGPAPRRKIARRPRLPRHPQLNPGSVSGWWQALHQYVSPRERKLTTYEAWVRSIAYGIKDGDPSAIRTAAKAMSMLVPNGAWVIPAPASRAWSYGGVRRLAEEIARAVGGSYAEPVARATTVDSSHERRRAGGVGLTVEQHMASMESRMRGPCSPDQPIVIVDNVATSGATLEAVRRLMGPDCDVRAVVWAEAKENAP